jgi:hypothetical protein
MTLKRFLLRLGGNAAELVGVIGEELSTLKSDMPSFNHCFIN